MRINGIIGLLDSLINDPSEGLPEDVLLFVSRITPLVNVDLLIKNSQGQTLLTWRDDGLHPAGWHIPGGIIRFKETVKDRIHAVAATELGTEVKPKTKPLAIKEVIARSRPVRAHFISLLYECTLLGSPDERRRYAKGTPKPGEWAWHQECPRNLICVQKMYREFI